MEFLSQSWVIFHDSVVPQAKNLLFESKLYQVIRVAKSNQHLVVKIFSNGKGRKIFLPTEVLAQLLTLICRFNRWDINGVLILDLVVKKNG